jgi:hypothetical protein
MLFALVIALVILALVLGLAVKGLFLLILIVAGIVLLFALLARRGP